MKRIENVGGGNLRLLSPIVVVEKDKNICYYSDNIHHIIRGVFMKKRAFTLAEILITLGIIGVVAALTLPSLISNYQKKVTAAKLKQTYSILSNAIAKEQALTGIPFSSYYALEYRKDVCPTGYEFTACSNALFEDYLKDNLTGNVEVLNSGLGDIFDKNIASVLYGKGFILPNGVGVNIYGGAFAVVPNYKKTKDPKKRLKLIPGKNLFNFGKYHVSYSSDITNVSGLLPMSKSQRKTLTRDDLITRCKSTNLDTAISACSQLFIEDGFEFSKDYPIKF